MIDVLQSINIVLREFNRGLLTRIDDRDAPQDSLADIRGFNLSERVGRLVRDFGATRYNGWSLPLNSITNSLQLAVTNIYGIGTFRIEALSEEFVLVYGTSTDSLPHLWMRKSYNKLIDGSGVVDNWFELTAFETITLTRVGDIVFKSLASLMFASATNFYATWTIYNITRNSYAYVVASVLSGLYIEFTTLESHHDWQTGDSAKIYRNLDTKFLNFDSGAVGANQWFSSHVIQEKLDIGWQRSAPTTEFPVMIQRVNSQFFFNVATNDFLLNPNADQGSAAANQAVLRGYDQLYLSRESPSYDSLASLGVDIAWDAGLTIVQQLPTTTVTNVGWTNGDGGSLGDLCNHINDGKLETYLTGTSTPGVAPSNFVFQNTIVANATAGFLRVNVTARHRNTQDQLLTVNVYESSVLVQAFVLKVTNTWSRQSVQVSLNSFTNEGANLQIGLYVFSIFGSSTIDVAEVSSDQMASSPQLTNTRAVVVPQFDNYLIGKPILLPPVAGNSVYPQIKIQFALMDKRLTQLFVFLDNGVTTKTLGQFVSGWTFNIAGAGGNVRDTVYDTVGDWSKVNVVSNAQNVGAVYQSAAVGTNADQPRRLTNGRDETVLQRLDEFLGYGLVDAPVDIAPKWRYQVQAAFRQDSEVFVDQSDDVLRLAVYSGTVLNDHTYPQVTTDITGAPLMVFLNAKGELLGLLGQLGKIYAFKKGTAEILDATSTQSIIYSIDCIAKHGILLTSVGIIFCGQYGIYLFPSDGGLSIAISDAIRDEYDAILNTTTFPYKTNIVAGECKDMGCIMFTIQKSGAIGSNLQTDYTTYFYHTQLNIWWKREFTNPPASYAPLTDNTLLFGGRSTSLALETKLLRYPDRTTYVDDGLAAPFYAETQWIMGDGDFYKILRTVMPAIISTVGTINFIIRVRFDRSASDYDTLTATSVNGLFEQPLIVKTPNSWRECKLVIQNNGTPPDGRFEVSETRILGETFSNAKSN